MREQLRVVVRIAAADVSIENVKTLGKGEKLTPESAMKSISPAEICSATKIAAAIARITTLMIIS